MASTASGDVVLFYWREPATLESWRYFIGRLERAGASFSDGVVCLDLIAASSKPPDAALRARMQEDLRRLGPKLRRLVVVPLGDGIWLAVVRSIVRAVLLLSGASRRHAVGATLSEGLERVKEVAGSSTPSAAELRACVDQLCAALGVQAPEPSRTPERKVARS